MSGIYMPAEYLHAQMMKRVVRDDASPCWLFTGSVNSKGYGCVAAGRKGRNVLTHRLAVMHRDGSIPDGMTVDHLCGQKRCVRPDHLEVVTRAENSRRGNQPWLASNFLRAEQERAA